MIYSKRVLLTIALLSFSIGSYTYSESTSEPGRALVEINIVKSEIVPISLQFPSIFSKYRPNDITKSNLSIPLPSEDVMDSGNIDAEDLADFLIKNNSNLETDYAKFIAEHYIKESELEGVNSDLAFAQMCLETGFLNYGGDVDKTQNNFCGLGATGNGAKGHSFSTPEEGIRAHIQHLKAYGSTRKLNNELVDQRFRFVERGSGVELKDLTGKWATDKLYDKKIRKLLKRLYDLDPAKAS